MTNENEASKKFVDVIFDEFTNSTIISHKEKGEFGHKYFIQKKEFFAEYYLFYSKTSETESTCLSFDIIAENWFWARKGEIIFNCDQNNYSIPFNEAKTNTGKTHWGPDIKPRHYIACFEYGFYVISNTILQAICDCEKLKIRIVGERIFEPGESACDKFQLHCRQFYNNVFDQNAYTQETGLIPVPSNTNEAKNSIESSLRAKPENGSSIDSPKSESLIKTNQITTQETQIKSPQNLVESKKSNVLKYVGIGCAGIITIFMLIIVAVMVLGNNEDTPGVKKKKGGNDSIPVPVINPTASPQTQQTDPKPISTAATPTVVEAKPSIPLGTWSGTIGSKNIILKIEQVTEDKIIGYNQIENGKMRPVKGFYSATDDVYDIVLKEPGDDKWDGEFELKMENNNKYIMKGKWKANNGKLIREVQFTKSTNSE